MGIIHVFSCIAVCWNQKNLLECKVLEECSNLFQGNMGWLGGAMVLGKLPVPGRPTNLD